MVDNKAAERESDFPRSPNHLHKKKEIPSNWSEMRTLAPKLDMDLSQIDDVIDELNGISPYCRQHFKLRAR